MRCALTAELVTQKTKEAAVRFLAANEASCVSLMERLLSHSFTMPPSSPADRFVLIRQKDEQGSGILALCMISPAGLVLHSIAFGNLRVEDRAAFKDELARCIRPYLEGISITRLLGDTEGCRFMRTLCPQNPVQVNEYELMVYNPASRPAPADLSVQNLTVRCAESADLRSLLPLQEAYEREEVIPPGGMFNPDLSRMTLYTTLETQLVCIVCDAGGNPVAKAGTNARGLNWYQLGGVYTLPAWRSKGLARTLVQHLADSIAKDGLKTVLFVRKENERALRSYTHAGFVYNNDYNIIYFRL